MTKEEAFIFLDASEDNLEDVYLNKIFEHKQFLLKSVLTPQVFRKRSEKIYQLGLAYNVLNNGENIAYEPTKIIPSKIDLVKGEFVNFYRQYESDMSRLKLTLMQTLDAQQMALACANLAELEHWKLLSLAETFEDFQLDGEEIKISEFINSGLVLKELKQIEFEEMDDATINLCPTLLKDIHRSRKYRNFTLR